MYVGGSQVRDAWGSATTPAGVAGGERGRRDRMKGRMEEAEGDFCLKGPSAFNQLIAES